MTTAIHLQFDYLGQHTPNHPFEQKDHLELEPEFNDNSHIDIFYFKRMASVSLLARPVYAWGINIYLIII